MKVAYLALGEEFGSAHAGFTHSYSICQELDKSVDLKLFIGKGTGQRQGKMKIVETVMPSARNLFKSNPIRYLESFFKLRKELKDADLIHERFHINPIDLFFVGKRKYVLEVNDPGLELQKGFFGWVKKQLINLKFKRADAIITQTETLKGILARHCRKPIFVVSNGVDLAAFRGKDFDIRKEFGIKESETLVTYAGSFREWHGVQAIPAIAEKIANPKIKFLLIGDGPFFGKVKKKAGNNPKIILAGKMPAHKIPSALLDSDILIAPFNTANFKTLEKFGFWWCPVKLFEYLAAGKPVVSVDFPEVRRIVGKAGLLAQAGNESQLIGFLSKLDKDKKLRQEMGREAKKLASRHSWSGKALETEKVYRKTMEG